MQTYGASSIRFQLDFDSDIYVLAPTHTVHTSRAHTVLSGATWLDDEELRGLRRGGDGGEVRRAAETIQLDIAAI